MSLENSVFAARRSFYLALAIALMVAIGVLWEVRAATEGTNVIIGFLLPPEEAEADSLRDGAQLAVESANQASSHQVRLVVRGRAGQWGADAVEAARMVLDDGAQGLIAPPNGAATHLALQVAGRTAVPVISLCGDSSVSATGVPWMVRIAPTSIEEAKILFTDLDSAVAGSKRWTALVPDGRAGREAAADLRQAALITGCELNRVFEVNPSLTNLCSIVVDALKDQPDAIFVWLDPGPAGMLAKSLRTAGFSGKLAGPSRCNSPVFLGAFSDEFGGFFVPAVIRGEVGNARLLSFQNAFRERYGREADLTAAESYDAATLLIHLIKKTDPKSLPRAFPLAFSLPGASGDLIFDPAGNRRVALRLLIDRRGHFEPVEGVR